MFTKYLSIFLVLIVLVCAFSLSVYAAEPEDFGEVYISANALKEYFNQSQFSYNIYSSGSSVIYSSDPVFYVDSEKDILWIIVPGNFMAGGTPGSTYRFEFTVDFNFVFYSDNDFKPNIYIAGNDASFYYLSYAYFSCTDGAGVLAEASTYNGSVVDQLPSNYGVGSLNYFCGNVLNNQRNLIQYTFPSQAFGDSNNTATSIYFSVYNAGNSGNYDRQMAAAIGISGFKVFVPFGFSNVVQQLQDINNSLNYMNSFQSAVADSLAAIEQHELSEIESYSSMLGDIGDVVQDAIDNVETLTWSTDEVMPSDNTWFDSFLQHRLLTIIFTCVGICALIAVVLYGRF